MIKYLLVFASLFAISLAQLTNCGLTPYTPKSKGRQLKIVGGTEAPISAWPWQIVLKYKGTFVCGGSIINNSWIVTAAHCTYGHVASSYTVDVGVNNRLKNDAWAITNIKVSKLINHPSYNPKTLKNDISLLKLAVSLKFDSSFRVNAVCLPINSASFQNKVGWATGWGTTSSGGSVSSKLLQVDLPILSDTDCYNYQISNKFTLITPSLQVCSGQKYSGKDTCQGDSGGPLVYNSNNRWNLVGITSYGYGCGVNSGVYTRASGYYKWIIDTVKIN